MTVPVGRAPGDGDDVGTVEGLPGSDRYPVVSVARAICPYLASADGSWRSSEPSRDHHCTAVVPAAQLSADKQRRLCLTARHELCATYVAAREEHAGGREADAVPDGRDRTPWALGRSAPVLLDGRSPAAVAARLRTRWTGQVGLAILMVAAFGAIVLARGVAAPEDASRAGSSPSAAAVAARPSPSPAPPSASPSPSPVPSPSPSPVLSPSPVAAASPSPASTRTYTVRSGDTLGAIAQHFDTTVKALQELNGIEDPAFIRVGQALKIP